MTLSDDGGTAAFWNWEPGISPDKDCHVHILDLETREDRRMSYDPSARCELLPQVRAPASHLLDDEPAHAVGHDTNGAG